jgi:hypothetical protein
MPADASTTRSSQNGYSPALGNGEAGIGRLVDENTALAKVRKPLVVTVTVVYVRP